MKASLIVSAALTLVSTATAATINKARQEQPSYPAGDASSPDYTPAPGSSEPSYTLYYTSQLQGSQSSPSVDGNVYVSLQSGDVLISVQVVNPADDAACFVRDAQGNQIRAFGGPDQDVDSIQFQYDDGKQARSINCQPA